MSICEHYEYNNIEKRYISTVKRLRKHVFECMNCHVTLHDADVVRLNDYIRYINKDSDVTGIRKQKADIYEMVRPIPREIKSLDLEI